jgi:hypothetical protein
MRSGSGRVPAAPGHFLDIEGMIQDNSGNVEICPQKRSLNGGPAPVANRGRGLDGRE